MQCKTSLAYDKAHLDELCSVSDALINQLVRTCCDLLVIPKHMKLLEAVHRDSDGLIITNAGYLYVVERHDKFVMPILYKIHVTEMVDGTNGNHIGYGFVYKAELDAKTY